MSKVRKTTRNDYVMEIMPLVKLKMILDEMETDNLVEFFVHEKNKLDKVEVDEEEAWFEFQIKYIFHGDKLIMLRSFNDESIETYCEGSELTLIEWLESIFRKHLDVDEFEIEMYEDDIENFHKGRDSRSILINRYFETDNSMEKLILTYEGKLTIGDVNDLLDSTEEYLNVNDVEVYSNYKKNRQKEMGDILEMGICESTN